MVSSIDFIFEKISQKKDNRFGLIFCRYRSGKNVRRLSLGIYVTEDDWMSFLTYTYCFNKNIDKNKKKNDDWDGGEIENGEILYITEKNDKNSGHESDIQTFKKLASNIVSTLGITNERLDCILNDIRERLLNDEDLVCTDDVVPYIIRTRVALLLLDRFHKYESQNRSQIKSVSLLKCMERYADDKECGKRLKEGTLEKVTASYIRRLRMIINNLRAFERFRGEKIMLEDVNMELRDEYIDWCRSKGLSTNSIVQRVEAIHCVMKVAYEEGLTENAIYAHSCFVPKPEKVGSIILSSCQLQELYELDLSTEEKINELLGNCHIGKRKMDKYKNLLTPSRVSILGQARDIFIVGCLTGQRYSDYKRLNANMIIEMNGMSFIGVVQEKTRHKVVIPLDERVVEILNSYEDGLPNLSISQLNACLHLIGELLHWTWKPEFNGNAPHSQSGIRFCDLLTTHTARRSFATKAYAQRVPVKSIMAITGHTSELRLRGYVRDAPEAGADIVAEDFDGFLDL